MGGTYRILMKTSSDRYVQLAFNTGQYSVYKLFRASCCDLPWEKWNMEISVFKRHGFQTDLKQSRLLQILTKRIAITLGMLAYRLNVHMQRTAIDSVSIGRSKFVP